MAQSKAEKSWAVLQQLDVSQPTRTRTTPLDEPEISPPPAPPVRPKLPKEEEPEVDPFDIAREKYRVDLVEVFKTSILGWPGGRPKPGAVSLSQKWTRIPRGTKDCRQLPVGSRACKGKSRDMGILPAHLW